MQKEDILALIDQLVKIKEHKGLYLKDNSGLFLPNKKEVTVAELEKKLKIPYSIYARYYEGKSAKYESHVVTDTSKTVNRICREIAADRGIAQINKTFIESNKKTDGAKMTLDELFDEHERVELNKRKESYKSGRRYFYSASISPKLGNKKITELATEDFQKIVDSMQGALKPRTTEMVKQIIRPLYKYAMSKGYYKDNANPGESIKIEEYDNTQHFGLPETQYIKLYEIINNFPDAVYRAFFIFLLHGRRRGETRQMLWTSIDLSLKTYCLGSDITKAAKSQIFPLSEAMISAIAVIPHRTRYIFSWDAGATHIKDMRSTWKSILKQAGIEKMRLHDIRHLIGFIAVNNNVEIYTLSKILAHSNVKTTEKYAKVKLDTLDQNLEKIQEILRGKKK